MAFIVKNTTFISPLDLIAPHTCQGCKAIGDSLCKKCKNYIIKSKYNFCPNCKKPITTHKCPRCTSLPPIYVVGNRQGLLSTIIHNYKYDSNRSLARPLAELLFERLPKIDGQAIIVPLPTTASHIRQRGFDHTLLLAKHLAQISHCQVQPLLLRVRDTTQVGTDKITRINQANNAYTINPKLIISPEATYIILDDVWTTGASMKAATKIVQQAGAKHIIIGILAVSQLD